MVILLRAWGVLIMARAALVLLPFSLVRSLVTDKKTASTHREKTASADDLAWAVTAASRFVPGGTCLVQAVALQYLLQRAGHPALMHIGVNKDEARGLKAHAWVESRGRILIGGSNLRDYTRLLALE